MFFQYRVGEKGVFCPPTESSGIIPLYKVLSTSFPTFQVPAKCNQFLRLAVRTSAPFCSQSSLLLRVGQPPSHRITRSLYGNVVRNTACLTRTLFDDYGRIRIHDLRIPWSEVLSTTPSCKRVFCLLRTLVGIRFYRVLFTCLHIFFVFFM